MLLYDAVYSLSFALVRTSPVTRYPVPAAAVMTPMALVPRSARVRRIGVTSAHPHVAVSVPRPVTRNPIVTRTRCGRGGFINWSRRSGLNVDAAIDLCGRRNGSAENRAAERTCKKEVSQVHHAFFLPPHGRRLSGNSIKSAFRSDESRALASTARRLSKCSSLERRTHCARFAAAVRLPASSAEVLRAARRDRALRRAHPAAQQGALRLLPMRDRVSGNAP
jgi:hypothetical protein